MIVKNTQFSVEDYRPPEVLTGKYEFKADIYGLGVILYQLVTGRKFTTEHRSLHKLTRSLE